jgi:hypothetical protein
MRRAVLLVAVIVAVLTGLVAAAMPAGAQTGLTALQARRAIAVAPCTAFRFGTQDRAFNGPNTIGPIAAVRVGRHSCFDRLVVDVAGPLPGWSVGYRTRLIQDASGRALPFRGVRVLEIVLRTNAHDINTGRPTLTGVPRPSFPEFRDLILASDFEGQTQLGVGVAHVRPFRVFTLPGARGHTLWILDVKH